MSDDTKSEQPAPAANGAKKEVVWGRSAFRSAVLLLLKCMADGDEQSLSPAARTGAIMCC